MAGTRKKDVRAADSNGPASSADGTSAVVAYFEASASYWNDIYSLDDVMSVIVQQRNEIALSWVDRLDLPPGSAVLELGCGAGLTAVALAERGLKICATDAAAAMVDLARTRAAESGLSHLIEVRTSDVHALDFEDGTFDLVIALGVIPWLHSPSDAVREMVRVLKPGRALIVSVNNSARLHHLLDPRQTPRLAGARRAVKKVLRINSSSGVPSWHPHSCDEFERLLSDAGLIKEEGRTFGFGPFTFLGRRVLPARIGVDLHNRLQRLADEGQAGLASRGAQYIVVAEKQAGAAIPEPYKREAGLRSTEGRRRPRFSVQPASVPLRMMERLRAAMRRLFFLGGLGPALDIALDRLDLELVAPILAAV